MHIAEYFSMERLGKVKHSCFSCWDDLVMTSVGPLNAIINWFDIAVSLCFHIFPCFPLLSQLIVREPCKLDIVIMGWGARYLT